MTQRTTWDYLVIPETDRDQLARLGDEGWELVAAGGLPGEQVLYLKRPRFDFRERVTLDQRAAYFAARGLDPEAVTDGGGK